MLNDSTSSRLVQAGKSAAYAMSPIIVAIAVAIAVASLVYLSGMGG